MAGLLRCVCAVANMLVGSFFLSTSCRGAIIQKSHVYESCSQPAMVMVGGCAINAASFVITMGVEMIAGRQSHVDTITSNFSVS